MESIDCDALRIHYNSVQCQRVCFGGVRLHQQNHGDSANLWDYPVAAQILLTQPGHPHIENYESSDVHTDISFGINNASPTEFLFELTNHYAMAAGSIWRDEVYLTLESYKIVTFATDLRTRGVNVTHVLN